MDLRGPGALECPLPGVETQLCTRHCGAVAHRHEQKGQAARVSPRYPGIGEEVVELEPDDVRQRLAARRRRTKLGKLRYGELCKHRPSLAELDGDRSRSYRLIPPEA